MSDQPSSSHQLDVQLRPATIIRQDAEKMFKELGIEVPEPIMPARIPVPPNGNVRLVSNFYPAHVNGQVPIHRYDVEMTIARRNGSQLALTKKSTSDAVSIDRKAKTKAIFSKMVATHPELFTNMYSCIYDLESMLFTLKEIEEVNLIIDGLDGEMFQGTTSATVNLKKCHDRYELDLTNYGFLQADVGSVDLSHKQFLELITSQIPMMSEEFVCFPGGISFGYHVDATPLSDAKNLYHGVQKSIRYVENPATKKPMAAVAVDLRKTTFHQSINAFQYMCAQVQVENASSLTKVSKAMKGIRCKLTYGRRYREMVIHAVVNKSPRSTFFKRGEQDISVEQYFYEVYQITLRYPNGLMAAEKKPGQRELCYFPMELLEILDNQRVSGELPQAVVSAVIKQAAVLPAQRRQEIQQACNDIGLFDNEYLRNIQTTVEPRPIEIEGRLITNPKLIYGNNVLVDSRKGQWPNRGANKPKFFLPAVVRKWTFLMISEQRNGQATGTMNGFLKEFIRECQMRGMTLPHPSSPYVLDTNRNVEDQLEEFMRDCSEGDYEFVFVLQDGIFKFHKLLKYLERKYQVITQDLKTQTGQRCLQRAAATLENIVQKTNMKLGGLNYSLQMTNPGGRKSVFDESTMFVGLSMTHGKPLKPDSTGELPPRPASVVGFAANTLPQQFAFIGDYYFQAADRDEKIDSIVPIMTILLTKWSKHHDGQMPMNVVIFRNGASEGQYKNVLRFEIPLVKYALEKFREAADVEQIHPETKLCMLVSNKHHSTRIFKTNVPVQGRAPEQNLEPGIAVDRAIVNPVFQEFYINSHTTLQGTGRVPRYAILNNDAGYALGHLEHIVFGLAHGHQIVNMTTSLPTPAYIASDYGDRGMVILTQFLREFEKLKGYEHPVDAYQEFNQSLTYASLDPDCKFNLCRVNA
ncbi:hypothetical protein L596_016158 [Steinernema carpocapsae]|uniref:Piwi domain-containing protein n=1 Tax=Steinernema carpocapsae TaxID=34508 RepID=A0A4U5NID3_STECR|nr:hypothetical protein L596_016158 [Steinernema carpocapsae]